MSTILEPGQIEASAVMPPFLHLPADNLFELRALRLEHLAQGHALGEYLRLIARLCRVQQQLMDDPPSDVPVAEARQRLCISHGLPPLAADSLVREGPWLIWLQAHRSGRPLADLAAGAARPLRCACAGCAGRCVADLARQR